MFKYQQKAFSKKIRSLKFLKYRQTTNPLDTNGHINRHQLQSTFTENFFEFDFEVLFRFRIVANQHVVKNLAFQDT